MSFLFSSNASSNNSSVSGLSEAKTFTPLSTAEMSKLKVYVPNLGNNMKAPREHNLSARPVANKAKRGKSKAKPSRKTGAPKMSSLEVQKSWNTFAQVQPFLNNGVRQYNTPYYVTQMIVQTNLFSTSLTIDTVDGVEFTVNQLNQISTLTSLFDQYKIVCIECWIQYSPSAGATTAGGETASQWASAVDYDDSGNPTSYNAMIEHEGALATTLLQGHYHRFTPHVAVATYAGAFTSYGNVTAPWIDAASPSVEHYGLKIAAQASTVVNPISITTRLHTLWRGVR